MTITDADLQARPDQPGQPAQWLSWSRSSATGLDPNAARGVSGVYLIWQDNGGGRRWLYVGAGADIAARLTEHVSDPRIRMHCGTGCDIHYAWAAVATLYRHGVLCHLARTLSPLVSEPLPAARALPVNLPD